MSMDLTKNDPIFLSTNYFSRYGDQAADLVVSTGSTLRERLYDMDPRSRWQSVGSNDAIIETITAGFWVPGLQSLQSVELIALLNHNAASIIVDRSADNGATAYTNVLTDAAVVAANTLIHIVVPVDINKIQIGLLTTQTANAEKALGGIVVAGDSFQPGPLFERKVEPPRLQFKGATMADGSPRSAPIFRSAASAHFWAAKCAFLLDDETARERFRRMALLLETFIFIPKPLSYPGEIYLCRIRPGSYNDDYIVPSESGGRAIQMIIEEIGGA